MKKLAPVLLIAQLAAAALYISPTGSDSNTGTKEKPFQTFPKAFAQLQNGDSVVILPGQYAQRILFDETVAADSGVTIIAEDRAQFYGDTVSGIGVNDGYIEIRRKRDVTVRNISLNNVSGYGIECLYSSGVNISSCSMKNIFSSGILVWDCSDVTVDNNVLDSACNAMSPSAVEPDGFGPDSRIQECISLANCTTFTVSNNRVLASFSDNYGGEGIDVKRACIDGVVSDNYVEDTKAVGIYIDGYDLTLSDLVVERNRVINCRDGIVVASEAGGTVRGVTIQNNLVDGAATSGIGVRGNGWGGSRPNYIYDLTIVHNTVVNGVPGWSEGIILDVVGDESDSIYIFNNLLAHNSGFQLAATDTTAPLLGNKIYTGYNLCVGTYPTYSATSAFDNTLSGSVHFYDSANGDFTLREGSAGIDAGYSALATQTDINGNVRDQEYPTVGCFVSKGVGIEQAPVKTFRKGSVVCNGNQFTATVPGWADGVVQGEVVSLSGRILRKGQFHCSNEKVIGTIQGLGTQPLVLRLKREDAVQAHLFLQ